MSRAWTGIDDTSENDICKLIYFYATIHGIVLGSCYNSRPDGRWPNGRPDGPWPNGRPDGPWPNGSSGEGDGEECVRV